MIIEAVNANNKMAGWMFWCPGCECHHVYWTDYDLYAKWEFNGNLEKPTFRPSLMNTYPDGRKCHIFVTDGRIQFLGDCYHSLANQTIDMIELER